MHERIAELTDWLLQFRREAASSETLNLPRYLAASDLHGNTYRLREILAVAERERIEHVFLVGDLYSGPGGWELFRLLRSRVPLDSPTAGNLTLMWGNHEVAFVAGMLGNDRQLRFFYNFGGQHVLAGANAEREARGDPAIHVNGSPRLTAAELAALRGHPELQQMCSWIQRTHRLFAVDRYGTAYLHAFPPIDRHGAFIFSHRDKQGLEALPLMEQDLSQAARSDDPVFSPLLQTPTSPVWALFEIHSANQFDHATRSHGVRQLVFGHRHHTTAVNVGEFNRQIGIAVDFDQGLGGFLILGAEGLTFHKFVAHDSHQTESWELVEPAGELPASATHRHEIEEFLFGRFVELERELLSQLPEQSAQAQREFEWLESLRARGFPRIHRLYAELYSHVNDLNLSREMFAAAVSSCDEDAFRSFIHLLFRQTQTLEQFGKDWYSPNYLRAKGVATVVLQALRDMPLARLGLLDMRMRGTTSRLNLAELYLRILKLEDPDLALLAVENLGTLRTPEAGAALRRAFFHDVRKVRVRAAETLAAAGESAYPLVVPLLRNADGWVRCLAMWTLAEMAGGEPARAQAVRDLRRSLHHEDDWFLSLTCQELLRKLGDRDRAANPEQATIPNLTSAVVGTLQEIVDSQNEPFRKSFQVYFITVELSSLVYRRGLIGLDIDDLRIYVNDDDYFPPYYRFYKSGDMDTEGRWRGWRRLWLRCETPNYPDGPRIIELSPSASDGVPLSGRTMVLYDHRVSNGRVRLPQLGDIVAQHGLGKVKDRVRHALLEQWSTAFTEEQRMLLSRIHAAALLKMLFELPAEIHVSEAERGVLQDLSRKMLITAGQKPKRVLRLVTLGEGKESCPRLRPVWGTIHPQWLDVPKYTVDVSGP